jgi:hypothetical protein
VALGSIGLGIAAGSTYTLSDEDKAEANRLMVGWAAGEGIPGWTEKSPVAAEVKNARTIHVFFDTSPHADNQPDPTGPHILTFSDPRVRVGVKHPGDRIGPEGDRTTDVTLLIGESRIWTPEWKTYLTIWTPTAPGDLKIECTWKKRLWGLQANVKAYVHLPGMGWIEAGKK